MIESSPSANDRVAAMAVHIAGIFFAFFPSLIVYLAVTNNPWLKNQARNALNFQLTLLIGWIIAGVLMIVLIGHLVALVIEVLSLVLSVVAALRANAGESYTYPFAIELIKA
jgi:uncharacterized protein